MRTIETSHYKWHIGTPTRGFYNGNLLLLYLELNVQTRPSTHIIVYYLLCKIYGKDNGHYVDHCSTTMCTVVTTSVFPNKLWETIKRVFLSYKLN